MLHLMFLKNCNRQKSEEERVVHVFTSLLHAIQIHRAVIV